MFNNRYFNLHFTDTLSFACLLFSGALFLVWICYSQKNCHKFVALVSSHFLTFFSAAVQLLDYWVRILQETCFNIIVARFTQHSFTYQFVLVESLKQGVLRNVFDHPVVHFLHISDRVNLALINK